MAIDPPYRLDPFRNIVNVHWEEPTSFTGGEPPYDHCWSTINQYSKAAVSYGWGPPEYLNKVTWYFGGTFYTLTRANCDNAAVIAMALAEFEARRTPLSSEIVFYDGLYITWDVGPTGHGGDAIIAVGAVNWNWNDEDTSCPAMPEGPNPGPPDSNGRPTYP